MREIRPNVIAIFLVGLSVGGCQHVTAITPTTQPTAISDRLQVMAVTPTTRPAESFLLTPQMLIISGGSMNGRPALIYLIDEERDRLSLLAYDNTRLEFSNSPIALERVFRVGVDADIHVAGAVAGRKYTAFLSSLPHGGEGLYVVNRHGIIALFTFDPATRKIVLLDAASVKEGLKQ